MSRRPKAKTLDELKAIEKAAHEAVVKREQEIEAEQNAELLKAALDLVKATGWAKPQVTSWLLKRAAEYRKNGAFGNLNNAG